MTRRTSSSIHELRELGYDWPPHRRIDAAEHVVDGVVDLAAVLARLEASLAFHRRERDEMHAFAARWSADVDDTTDRRDDVAGAILDCEDAIRAVTEIIDAISASPRRRKPPPVVIVHEAPSAARLAAIAERERLPTRAELRVLLATYFEGPIEDDVVDRIDRELRAVEADRERWGDLRGRFRSLTQGLFPLKTYRGQLWAERLWRADRHHEGGVLAAFVIAATPGYPRPRMYCPEVFIGTWRQTAAFAGRWELGPTGDCALTTTTDDAEARYVAPYARWCLEYGPGDHDFDLRGDRLVLHGGTSEAPRERTSFVIDEITSTRLELHRLGLSGPIRYTLARVLDEARVDPGELQAGRAIGCILSHRYRLERSIGSGDVGHVYEATVLDGGHPMPRVAVRVIVGLGALALARFREIARVGLPSRYSTGRDRFVDLAWHADPSDPCCYIVMQYIGQRRTLAHVIGDDGAYTVSRACRVASQLLDALHAIGVVHGGLRPGNIFVIEDALEGPELIRVADLGLASIAEDPQRTTSGPAPSPSAVMYMAPERLRGLEIDHRADLYAVGLCLYEMLAGCHAFPMKESAYELAADVLLQDARRLESVAPDVPAALVALVHRAIKKDPAERFASAHEMRAALVALNLF